MDAWYLQALAGAAVVVALIAWRVPRAVLWIGLLALSFILSSIWHDFGLPYAALFGASTNLAVCFALYSLAQLRWEMRVWNCIHAMIIIDLLYYRGYIVNHADFAIGLELANWLALAIVGATGMMERFGWNDAWRIDFSRRFSWTRFVYNRIWVPRSKNYRPFWQAKE